MDYDRNDALLHYLFRQTQGDAWFRPNESTISSGVALRINADEPEFRIFPYETPSLLPFEEAVRQLNPAVAVKIRSAAVHAAIAQALSSSGNSTPPSPPVDPTSIYIDTDTRIQILPTLLSLPQAERDQCAAFILDERVLVVWSDDLDRIIPMCNDFDDRLIKLLWRENLKFGSTSTRSPSLVASTPPLSGSGSGQSRRSSLDGSNENLAPSLTHSSSLHNTPPSSWKANKPGRASGHPKLHRDATSGSGLRSEIRPSSPSISEVNIQPVDEAPNSVVHSHAHSFDPPIVSPPKSEEKEKRTWYGKKYFVPSPPTVSAEDLEKALSSSKAGEREVRKVTLYAPVYNGLAAGLSFVIIGRGIRTLLQEFFLDGKFERFALVVTIPFLFCVSLFFSLQLIQNLTMILGPIEQYHHNSAYYSGSPPPADKEVDDRLPHVTIQMPVYKEGLDGVLAPSIHSLKRAQQTYARQGGTSSIFVCDDGLRVLPEEERVRRVSFYRQFGVAWVARPGQGDLGEGGAESGALDVGAGGDEKRGEGGERDVEKGEKGMGRIDKPFHRAGRFKKASNLNYGLGLSLKMERHLQRLMKEEEEGATVPVGTETNANSTPPQTQSLESQALTLAMNEMYEESGCLHRPWASEGNASGLRMGEIILLVDSDTVVPEDCLRDAAREMFGGGDNYEGEGGQGGEERGGRVAILQHESDVLKVAGHYFENGIAYFTRRVNRCISVACANGEIAPFMGHNAFLSWKAIQDVAFVDPEDGKEKIWSESNVSEDFDMALRVMQKGYVVRWATYSKGGFKEGVSLSVDDELNRWQKYSYGCSELLFNPIAQWWRKGPISKSIHDFVWSNVPIHYKISSLAYMFSYYGIAAGITIAIINYILLGFQFDVDGFYLHSFEIWLATTVVFFGSGTVGYSVLQYRLGLAGFVEAFLENLMWIPFFFFFFGGLSIPLTQAMLAHLFSYNITWSATIKEVERSNFFKEIPKIVKRFWFPLSLSFVLILGMIVCATPLVPIEWRVDGSGWAVIFPVATLAGCHILFPIVLNPWLMVFSY